MILVDYRCDACGTDQEHMVESPAPDFVGCEFCDENASWAPSPILGRVRRVEVTRGRWEKPERKTYLDTRKLGEGQDVDEFRAERRKVWRDHRLDRPRKEFLSK